MNILRRIVQNFKHRKMENWSIGKSATLTDLAMCINHYRVRTVGLYACIRVGVKLKNSHDLIYPDFMVMIGSGSRKQCYADHDRNYFVGPPNFILEIHEDTTSQYVEDRKKMFADAGVLEFLIVNASSDKVEWNRLNDGDFVEVLPDSDGLIKSTSLPGLWMAIDAIKKRDNWKIIAGIEHGITRRGHHYLMDSIWNKN